MIRSAYHLFLLVILAFATYSCQIGTSNPEEDSCESGRSATHADPFVLRSNMVEKYMETTEPVDINCHGKFLIRLYYEDANLQTDLTAPFPPVEIECGTNFILGSGFPLEVVDRQRDHISGQDMRYWEITADQGAKNLNAEQDWVYNIYIRLTDVTKPVVIEKFEIDYKKKKKKE